MTAPARIAIVGTGWWATDTHIPALAQRPDARLVALCDTNAQRLQAAATQYDIVHTYTDLAQMLAAEELDGAIVVSSNASHFSVTKACLEAGLHVMLEKPMTLYAAEAQALTELAARQGQALIVGYPFNYASYAVSCRRILAAGELGAVQYINLVYNSFMTPFFAGRYDADFAVHAPQQYTRPEQTGGGHGHVQITHGAGLLFFVTGLRPHRVNALMSEFGPGMDWIDAMTVGFENGAVGTVSGSGNWEGLTFRLEVGCERGWLDIDARKGRALVHRHEQRQPQRIEEEPGSFPRSYATAHNLVDVIVGQAENGSPAEVGWRAVELLDAAYRSAAMDGRMVPVAELYGRKATDD